ncbi:MAG: FAD-dependent oxidoreductase [Rhodobacterales bacterium]
MTRVLIIGAGPAGIRAAQTLVRAGLFPVVVDEGARAGGQIYRRPPDGFTRSSRALYGSEAGKAQALHNVFDQMVAEGRLRYLPKRSVLGLAKGVAHLGGPDGAEAVAYDRLILASGASDRLAPVPGWQAGCVYALGAAQIALKSQGVALGRRIVLAGSGPLLTLVAAQLVKAGAGVEAVLDTASLSAQIRGGLTMALARPVVTARGLALRAQLGRRYHAGVTLQRIATGPDGPQALHWLDATGRQRTTDCDTIAMGWHLRAETALADLAGVPFAWSDIWEQWLPITDPEGRAGEGLYMAGDSLRIVGADGAEISGRLAARACLSDLEMQITASDQARDLRRLARMQRFATGIARAFPWPAQMVQTLPDETVLCRCEGITAGALRATLPLSGAEVNRAKSLGRVGMGRCQGRYCQLAGAEVMAAASGSKPALMGRLRSQSPARPASVAMLVRQSDTG